MQVVYVLLRLHVTCGMSGYMYTLVSANNATQTLVLSRSLTASTRPTRLRHLISLHVPCMRVPLGPEVSAPGKPPLIRVSWSSVQTEQNRSQKRAF